MISGNAGKDKGRGDGDSSFPFFKEWQGSILSLKEKKLQRGNQ
jgi:hypothetical protein